MSDVVGLKEIKEHLERFLRGLPIDLSPFQFDHVASFAYAHANAVATKAVNEEREACAAVADHNNTDTRPAGEIAREIRARSTT